jgi:hypothetical protein
MYAKKIILVYFATANDNSSDYFDINIMTIVNFNENY